VPAARTTAHPLTAGASRGRYVLGLLCGILTGAEPEFETRITLLMLSTASFSVVSATVTLGSLGSDDIERACFEHEAAQVSGHTWGYLREGGDGHTWGYLREGGDACGRGWLLAGAVAPDP